MKRFTLEQLKHVSLEDLANTRMVSNSHDKSRAIQEAVFRLGGRWSNGSQSVLYSDKEKNFCNYMYIKYRNGDLYMLRAMKGEKEYFDKQGKPDNNYTPLKRITIALN